MENKPKYPVLTVEKSIEILEFLAKDSNNKGVGVTELAKAMDMGKSSVHRILDTLLHYGYVAKSDEGSRYRLGWGLYTIGQRVPQQNQLFNLDSAYIVELGRKTGETVNIGVRDRNQTIIISKIQSANVGFRFDIQAGEHESLHATALGKILLSEKTDQEVYAILGRDTRFHRFTDNTIQTVDELIDHLATIREKGYAMDNQEFAMGLVCIAMPIRDYTGKIIAAISVTSPSNHINPDRIAFIVHALRECCERTSWTLGYRQGSPVLPV